MMRDSSYYSMVLLVLAYFFGVSSPQLIEWWEASILFALYWVYVLLMAYNQKLYVYVSGWIGSPMADEHKGTTYGSEQDDVELHMRDMSMTPSGRGSAVSFRISGKGTEDDPVIRNMSMYSYVAAPFSMAADAASSAASTAASAASSASSVAKSLVVKGSTLLPTNEPTPPAFDPPSEPSHRRTMSGVRSSVVEYDHSNHSSERREQWLRNRLSWLRAGVYKMLIAKPSLLEKAGAAMVMRISGSAEQVFRAFDNVRDRGGGGGSCCNGGGVLMVVVVMWGWS
jgi:hypothetical protein